MKEELIDLEKQYWTAIKEKDAAKAASMSDDPCVVAGAQGASAVDRKTLTTMLSGGQFDLDEFTLDNVLVHAVTDDVAIVAYQVTEKLRVEGEAVTLNAFDTSVWVRRDGKWLCALHTESLKGDPYGRR